MTKDDKELVINALKVIRAVCDHEKTCDKCCLGSKDGGCMLDKDYGYDNPSEWQINMFSTKGKIWRALVDEEEM